MKVGIVGLGYWGPNLVKNFLAQKNVEKVVACDQRTDRLDFVKTKSPSVLVSSSYEEMLKSDIDAVVIATPVQSHYTIAKQALEAGKHIWVEKPFTSTSQQAEELLEIAEKKNLRIFIDHTFIYTGAVRKMKEIVTKGELGKILYFDSVRINLGIFQKDINVVWDLAPHDLSIMNYVLGEHHKIAAVSAK